MIGSCFSGRFALFWCRGQKLPVDYNYHHTSDYRNNKREEYQLNPSRLVLIFDAYVYSHIFLFFI